MTYWNPPQTFNKGGAANPPALESITRTTAGKLETLKLGTLAADTVLVRGQFESQF